MTTRVEQNVNSQDRNRLFFILALGIGVSILFFSVIKGFIMPLTLAAVLAAVVRPLYLKLLGKLKGKEAPAALLTILLFMLVVVVPVLLFTRVLVQDAMVVGEKAGDWVTQITDDPAAFQTSLPESQLLQKLIPHQEKILEKAAKITGAAAAYLTQLLVGGIAGLASFGLKLFICFFAMFQFLIGGKKILDAIFSCMPLSDSDRYQMTNTFASVSRATLKGTLVIGIVQGALGGISFAIAGIEGAIFWSVVMAVFSIIPGVGTAIVWVPTVIYLFVTGQTGAAIGVGLWCGIVVSTADNVLRPLLVGKDTKMSELMVLITTLGGLSFAGAAGIVIGPVIGALFTTIWCMWRSTIKPPQAKLKPF